MERALCLDVNIYNHSPIIEIPHYDPIDEPDVINTLSLTLVKFAKIKQDIKITTVDSTIVMNNQVPLKNILLINISKAICFPLEIVPQKFACNYLLLSTVRNTTSMHSENCYVKCFFSYFFLTKNFGNI